MSGNILIKHNIIIIYSIYPEKYIYLLYIPHHVYSEETKAVDNKLRVSLAFYSYFIDNNRDHYKTFGMFILKILKDKDILSESDLEKELKKKFGLIIPSFAFQQIILALERNELIHTDKFEKFDGSTSKYYKLTEKGIGETKNFIDESLLKEKLDPFFLDVRDFLDKRSHKQRKGRTSKTIPNTRKIFLKFIDRNISPLLYYTHNKDDSLRLLPSIDDYFKKSKRKTDVYLCEYTKEVKNSKREYYKLIEELIEGSLLSIFFNVDPKYINMRKNLPKPDVYLDTNLLIYLLDYMYVEFTKPAKEMEELLLDWGFNLKVFDFTVKELTRVLRYCTTPSASYQPGALVNSVCSFFKENNWSKTKILKKIANIDEEIEKLGIEIVPTGINLSKYDDNYIDNLRKEIREYRVSRRKKQEKDGKIEYSDSPKSVDHDLLAFLKIREIRNSELIYNFEDSKAIFLTADQGLASFNLKSHISDNTIPEIYLDKFITELLWSKDPKATLTVETLIAACARDIFIHPDIWDHFLEKLYEKYPDEGKDNINKMLSTFLNYIIIDRLAMLDPDELGLGEVEKIVEEIPSLDVNNNLDELRAAKRETLQKSELPQNQSQTELIPNKQPNSQKQLIPGKVKESKAKSESEYPIQPEIHTQSESEGTEHLKNQPNIDKKENTHIYPSENHLSETVYQLEKEKALLQNDLSHVKIDRIRIIFLNLIAVISLGIGSGRVAVVLFDAIGWILIVFGAIFFLIGAFFSEIERFLTKRYQE